LGNIHQFIRLRPTEAQEIREGVRERLRGRCRSGRGRRPICLGAGARVLSPREWNLWRVLRVMVLKEWWVYGCVALWAVGAWGTFDFDGEEEEVGRRDPGGGGGRRLPVYPGGGGQHRLSQFSDRRVPPGPVIFVHQEAADQRDEYRVTYGTDSAGTSFLSISKAVVDGFLNLLYIICTMATGWLGVKIVRAGGAVGRVPGQGLPPPLVPDRLFF